MGLLSKIPWPDDSMSSYFVVDKVGETFVDRANGLVLSCNPTDPFTGIEWQHRPAGTAGGYEKMTINGAQAVYNPVHKGHHITAFLYWPNGAPNV